MLLFFELHIPWFHSPVKREREGDSHPAEKKQKPLSKEEALEEKALKVGRVSK